MVSFNKSKSTSFYVTLSAVLVLSGIALIVTADYSSKTDSIPKDEEIAIETLNESDALYPWSDSGPEYISKSFQNYEFCKQSKCWGFDATNIQLTNNGESYDIAPNLSQSSKLEFSSDHQNFTLNYSTGNVYLCSDEFCWIVNEGTNNIQPDPQFVNLSGKSSSTFAEMKPF